jgi:hypothetical protein
MCVHFGGDSVFMSVGCIWMMPLILSSVEMTAYPMSIYKGEYHFLSSTGIYQMLLVFCYLMRVCALGGDLMSRQCNRLHLYRMRVYCYLLLIFTRLVNDKRSLCSADRFTCFTCRVAGCSVLQCHRMGC